ncbi:LuxR C-terminal-related transcriptional regulator [Streptomyces mobaraensis]|uniref:Helix-turn-helix transcriptional regulator n=1 Tax=Streptomyces mobaraensis TaxID=35621 RepID=A0A5N5W9I5_STRMB|nr:LuxR C-terminal-related transcriptional regulator [Streptomyces mobaraensis]KAB7846888.1 helix-turn-helix transcriptional regulator [Streptomyces mobaraensis]
MLTALGLDTATERVYRGMLRYPHAGVADLSRRLGLTERRLREALDQLVDMELLHSSRENPDLLRVVNPEVGLELLVRRRECELARRQEELARGKEAVARTVAEFAALRSDSRMEVAERLVGLDAVQGRLEWLAREVTEECLAINPGGSQSKASLDAARPLDEDALGRGVRLLVLYQDSVRNDQGTLSYARWMAEKGGEVRTRPVVPPRLLIFDRRTAVVPLDPGNSRLGAVCTRSPGIVAALVALFELAWETANPLGADGRGRAADEGAETLTPAERELLKILASGLTDEAAGKRLGVSLRTVRRQMAALMERLGATSRFEAGLKAARRGWL